jgi:hypothetical protein
LRQRRPFKDDLLDELAEHGNVAQFVSLTPGSSPEIRHQRLRPASGFVRPTTPHEGIASLLEASDGGSVNVRSFLPDRDKGCPFQYGLTTIADASAAALGLAEQGYFTIINETIDVRDGGVSGVALGGVVEFAPDATPRVVEEAGAAALPHTMGVRVLETVYGFAPDIPNNHSARLEFSIHPTRVGYRRSHTIWWEMGRESGDLGVAATILWPNRFSRHIGDKAYGLLLASVLGLPVPRTTVFGRRVAPFSFGEVTGTAETWIRTCPSEQAAGRYTTLPHWTDPYALLAAEDPTGREIKAVLAQEGVDSIWSGATMPSEAGDDFVQGVAGPGDAFMLGEAAPVDLPGAVVDDVRHLAQRAREYLGPIRMEWAHDGQRAWVVQMHIGKHFFVGDQVLSKGEANEWLDFYTDDGLGQLRDLLPKAAERGAGILVHGRIGITSHVGDLLRKAQVPGRLASST